MVTAIRPPLPEVLGALTNIGQPILAEHFAPNCCIAATRLATRVLERAGYAARPKVMWTRAGNRAFKECAMNEVPIDEWARRGARYVEIDGDNTDPGRYGGHLVAICQQTLVDLSAGQFHRPEKGIWVPPTVMLDLPYDWQDTTTGKYLKDGGVLMYRVAGIQRDYTSAPDWRPNRVAPAVDATLAALGVTA